MAVSRPAGAWLDGNFYMIGGESQGGGGTYLGLVQRYDSQRLAWDTDLPAMPLANTNGCAAAIGRKIYLPGGSPSAITNGRVELQVLDIDTGNWAIEESDPMPSGVMAHTCTALGSRLFVFGGSLQGVPGTTALVYDSEAPSGQRWTELPPLPFSSRYLGSASDGRDIFIAGGAGEPVSVGLVDAVRFDPDTETYSPLPDLNQGRGGVQLAVLYNRLYAVGGGWSSYLTSVESLDLDFPGEWESGGNVLGQGRRTFALAAAPEQGTIYVAGGWSGVYMSSSERLPRTRSRWQLLPPQPVPLARATGTLVDGALYVLGGVQAGPQYLGHVQRYRLATGQWELLQEPMAVPAAGHCAAFLDGQILVAGGIGASGVTVATLSRFDPLSETSEIIASDPLPGTRAAHSCAVLAEHMYVVGGSSTGAAGSSVLRYDAAAPAGMRWSSVADLPAPRSHAGLASDDKYLYIAGGIGAGGAYLQSAARYNPALDEWQALPDLAQQRPGTALLVRGDRLYAIAGGWITQTASVETLSLQNPVEWQQELDGLQYVRRSFAAASDGSTMLVAGGWDGSYMNRAEIYFDDTLFADDFE